jgi:hypothetical protein
MDDVKININFSNLTEQVVSTVSTYDLHSGGFKFESWTRHLILWQIDHDFLQSDPVNTGIVKNFKIRLVGGGVRLGPLGTAATDWLVVACPGWLWWWRNWWNKDWKGKPKYSEKTCPSATLSTTNPTWPDPGSNPGHRGGKPATNRLSYVAAHARIVSQATTAFFQIF